MAQYCSVAAGTNGMCFGTAGGVLGGPRVLGAPNEAHISTSPVPRTPEMLVGVGARLSTHAAALSPSNDTSLTGEVVRCALLLCTSPHAFM